MRVLKMLSVVALVLLMLIGCGNRSDQREFSETMDRWEVLVRWSQYDALIDFIHPEWLEENPIRSIDISRLEQYRISEYRLRQVLSSPDEKAVERLVRLRMYHIHSARERVVDFHEVWRYDEDYKRWLLHSGLPDPTAGRL